MVQVGENVVALHDTVIWFVSIILAFTSSNLVLDGLKACLEALETVDSHNSSALSRIIICGISLCFLVPASILVITSQLT